MEVEAKGFVRRVLLFKFKPETPPDHIEQLIKGYSNLVNLVESLKSWHMGKDVSIENLQEGFTHVFELTFESAEGIAEYMVHPAHLEFHELCWPHVEKLVVIDYKPTPFCNPN
ncbi:stress-response A/B barrel domain-containing protein HS1-like [Rhodamnia argentea]|uniref:Stress-response A/B barrel domain-containing protein HS1-like n=1 Tax=Rhodamnia argentea TaxID=178133 RepID=A0A8B8NDX4_9MYRT|nr:stress-response A/B barrel domain-containing protein HS1-like [Rhodamnia argentea]